MTSITGYVVLRKLGIGFGVTPRLQRVVMSANFHEQFCVPSFRYGRRDSLQVDRDSTFVCYFGSDWFLGK